MNGKAPSAGVISIGLNLLLGKRDFAGSAAVVRAQLHGGARNRAGVLGRDLALVTHVLRDFEHDHVAIDLTVADLDRAAPSAFPRATESRAGLLEHEGLGSTLASSGCLTGPL